MGDHPDQTFFWTNSAEGNWRTPTGGFGLLGAPPVDMPKGTSFIAPLEQRQREQHSDAAEAARNSKLDKMMNDFPHRPPMNEDEKAAFFSKIFAPQVVRDPGVPFAPFTDRDDPDALNVKCRKPLKGCAHLCQDPKLYNKECSFCRFVVDYERACGHKTPIYCGMKKSLTECKETCNKILGCKHPCREKCHFLRTCAQSCGEFQCEPEPSLDDELEPTPIPMDTVIEPAHVHENAPESGASLEEPVVNMSAGGRSRGRGYGTMIPDYAPGMQGFTATGAQGFARAPVIQAQGFAVVGGRRYAPPPNIQSYTAGGQVYYAPAVQGFTADGQSFAPAPNIQSFTAGGQVYYAPAVRGFPADGQVFAPAPNIQSYTAGGQVYYAPAAVQGFTADGQGYAPAPRTQGFTADGQVYAPATGTQGFTAEGQGYAPAPRTGWTAPSDGATLFVGSTGSGRSRGRGIRPRPQAEAPPGLQ